MHSAARVAECNICTSKAQPVTNARIDILRDLVSSFQEKPQVKNGWINGGFFIANKNFLNFIKKRSTILEKEPLEKASKKRQLKAYKHFGFWQCMDTKRDKDYLEKVLKKIKF